MELLVREQPTSCNKNDSQSRDPTNMSMLRNDAIVRKNKTEMGRKAVC